MRLFRKLIIPIAVILLYLPITSQAGFLVKRSAIETVYTSAATENKNTVAATIAGQSNGYTEHAVAHKKSFFGKIVQRFTGAREVFSAAKKKWLAILLGLLDIFVLGGIGLPRFYLGYTSTGLMQLIFYLLGFVGVFLVIGAFITGQLALLIPAYLCIGLCVFSWIWQIVDVIRIMCNSLIPKEGYWE